MPHILDRYVMIAVLAGIGSAIGGALFATACFIKRHWDQPLTNRRAIILLTFWAILNLILDSNKSPSFHFHHQIKLITHNYPLSKWYDLKSFNLPPLFAFL